MIENEKRVLIVVLLVVLVQSVSATVLYQENFDALAVGTFPQVYQQWYSGKGWSYAVVDNTQSVSFPNSFKMEGSQGWSQEVGVPVSLPSNAKIWFEVKTRVADAPSSFTNHQAGLAVVGFYKQSPRKNYGAVQFAYDPNTHSYTLLGGDKSIPYSPNTWYTIKIMTDLTSNTYSSWVNGIPFVTDYPVDSSEKPDSVLLNADNGGSYTKVWYDNLVVGYEPPTTTQPQSKVVAFHVAADHNLVMVTYDGGPDSGSLQTAKVSLTYDDGYTDGKEYYPTIGVPMTFAYPVSYSQKVHVVVVGKFNDKSEQVIVDTFTGVSPKPTPIVTTTKATQVTPAATIPTTMYPIATQTTYPITTQTTYPITTQTTSQTAVPSLPVTKSWFYNPDFNNPPPIPFNSGIKSNINYNLEPKGQKGQSWGWGLSGYTWDNNDLKPIKECGFESIYEDGKYDVKMYGKDDSGNYGVVKLYQGNVWGGTPPEINIPQPLPVFPNTNKKLDFIVKQNSGSYNAPLLGYIPWIGDSWKSQRNGIVNVWMKDKNEKILMVDLYFEGGGNTWYNLSANPPTYHYAATIADASDNIFNEVSVHLDDQIGNAISSAAKDGWYFDAGSLKIYQVEILFELKYAWGDMYVKLFKFTESIEGKNNPVLTTSDMKPSLENKFDITTPGFYSLDSDLLHSSPSGISIQTSSVTIDGNGHTISPSSKMTPSYGIWIAEKDMYGNPITNVQIKNILIKNEDTGIFMSGLKNSIINSVTVSENDKAIQLIRTDHITIQNSEIMKNREGIMMDNSHYNTITKNKVYDNQISGMHLYSASKNNEVIENVFSNNNYGISMGDVYFTTVSGNTISNNRMTGIHVHAGSSNNNIKNNELVNNEIVVEPDCINNILNNNLPIGKIPIETQTKIPIETQTKIPIETQTKIPIKTQTKNIPLPSTEFDYDTDGDGVSDGKEIQMHSDPLKKYTFNGLDDFNRLFTYADYNLDSQEKVNEFIIMIPNVKARDSRASEGYSTNIPMPVHDTIPENLNHALDDPIIGYYANKTVFNFDSDGKHGKITVDDEEVLKNGDMTLNGVNPAYYWTHGRPGACGSSTLATLAILRKMGLEAHMVAGTSLEGEFIMLDRAGHRWVEFNYEGNEYVSNFGEIRPKAEWYSKSKWTNATGDAPDFVI